MADEPVGIAVQRIVCARECTLPRELRHFVMTLAVLADRRTGRGLAGQKRIAAAMGVVSIRTVQRLFAELDARPDSPVRAPRTPRMQRSGRGRSSDTYQLVIVVDQGDTGVALKGDQGDTDGGLVSATNATNPDDQCDTQRTTNATSTARDTLCDPGSDPSSRDPGSRACARGPVYDSSTRITDELLDEFEQDTEWASREKTPAGGHPGWYVRKWQSDEDFFARLNAAAFKRHNRKHGRQAPGAIEHEQRKHSGNGAGAVADLTAGIARTIGGRP